ncbi:CBS domain-containing protein [Deinococcus misasensis]|uniref:CBS domain-containing protein n=1 Tax=Deinococcus misasensis TaxID=392413 RepID=UPI0005555AE7|nr:CBS domain-containing protein [Deinococcus misasensis]
MKVRDVMTPHPITVSPETSVPEAMQLMQTHGFRRLPVVEGGELVGIVTDRDLKEALPSSATTLSIWEMNHLLSRLQVAEVMSEQVITVKAQTELVQAAELMLTHKIGGLPVVSSLGHVIGIITVTEVLRAFVEQQHAAD